MDNVKKLFCILLISLMFVVFYNGQTWASESLDSTKKVVSLVFDDSGSMVGEKEENANYALQALISMLGANDELNIVKMSNPYEENLFEIGSNVSKQSSINSVRSWISNGGTPFDAVDTARDWLYKRKEVLNDNAEYWLIIITDGKFNFYYNGNNEIDIYDYMMNINNNFASLKFDSILLSIGNELEEYYIDAFNILPNCSVQEAKTADEIISSMFEISSKINSGLNSQEIEIEKTGTNEIVVDLNLPIYKMNIFIQKNGLEIMNITSDKNENVELEVYEIKTQSKNAKMTEIFSPNGFLKNGKYTITFNNEVDLNTTQIKVYVQAAVENVLKLYKRDENGDTALDDVDFYMLKENETIIAKSELVSLIDGTPIDISSLKNVDGFYYINDKKSYGKFEGTKLVTEIVLEPDKNNIYSLIESEGLINAKSNVIVIDFTNIEEVLIQYNNSEVYEKSEEISLEEIANGADITLNNLPEGIVIEYENVEYSNGEKILLNESNKALIIKANKQYRETSFNIVEILINSNDESYKKFLKVGPKTAKYDYVKVNKNQNNIDMNDGLLKLKIEYESEKVIKQLAVKDIKKVKIDNVTNGYKIKAILNEENDEIILKVVPTIFSIFSERKTEFSITSELRDTLGIASSELMFEIINYNVLKVLLPYIIGLLFVIILCGYLFKNRFSKTACIMISSDDSPYTLREYRSGARKFLPFMSDIAKLPNVEFKAKKTKRIELLSTMDEIIEVNGDVDVPKKIILSINNGEFVLRDGSKKVKYEYVSLTPDEIVEASEEKDNSEVNWF